MVPAVSKWACRVHSFSGRNMPLGSVKWQTECDTIHVEIEIEIGIEIETISMAGCAVQGHSFW